MVNVTRAIQMHYENTLGRTRKDFDYVCPSKELSELMLKRTLEFERELFPDADERAADVMSDFEKQSKSNLCIVDVKATMMEQEWQTFAETLKSMF